MASSVLVADDNDDNLYYLQALLAGAGYDVMTAKNGAEALQSALANPPALILTDVLMPVMDSGRASCCSERVSYRDAAALHL